MQLRDTIVAIATPPGHSGIGVVRLSGSESWAIALSKLQLSTGAVPAPRVATLAKLVDDDGHPIDHALATFFEAPNSYTAENVVEISCHGSPVVLQSCVRSMLAAGARAAEPGEFTLRAYVNGRLDLPRAEAVRDLINATTLHQARVAVQQVDGSVSKRIQPMKNELLELIALLEAGIDFAEDDISVATNEQILARLDPIEAAVDKLIRSFAYGRLVHSGFTLAILGRPNVGKSSLFNRLVGQERAIVTEIAGTTRDTVSETASLRGLPVRLVDTAGIRETDDLVESLGVQRSYQTLADADLVLIVVDLSEPLTQEDEALIRRASELGRYLIVGNKSDKAVGATAEDACRVSALTGEGIDALRERILQAIAPSGLSAEPGFITSLRHERLLHECSVALRACRDSLRASIPHEMLLLDLYSSLRALDEITGATTADDILNRIFSTFCIGK